MAAVPCRAGPIPPALRDNGATGVLLRRLQISRAEGVRVTRRDVLERQTRASQVHIRLPLRARLPRCDRLRVRPLAPRAMYVNPGADARFQHVLLLHEAVAVA